MLILILQKEVQHIYFQIRVEGDHLMTLEAEVECGIVKGCG